MSHRHGSSHLDADAGARQARQASLHVSETLCYSLLYVTGHRLGMYDVDCSSLDYGETVPHVGACRGVKITPKGNGNRKGCETAQRDGRQVRGTDGFESTDSNRRERQKTTVNAHKRHRDSHTTFMIAERAQHRNQNKGW